MGGVIGVDEGGGSGRAETEPSVTTSDRAAEAAAGTATVRAWFEPVLDEVTAVREQTGLDVVAVDITVEDLFDV